MGGDLAITGRLCVLVNYFLVWLDNVITMISCSRMSVARSHPDAGFLEQVVQEVGIKRRQFLAQPVPEMPGRDAVSPMPEFLSQAVRVLIVRMPWATGSNC